MRARRVCLWAAIAILAQASCAEIPTAPRQLVTLEGSIRTRDGEPLAAVALRFRDQRRPYRYPVPSAATAPDGSFHVDLVSGTYTVEIEPAARSEVPYTEVTDVRVEAPNPRFDYRFGGKRVEGTVIDPHGAPIQEASVWFRSRSAVGYSYVSVQCVTTNGRYRAYLPSGTYTCDVAPLGSMSGVPSLSFSGVSIGADTTVDLRLTGARVSGRATRPEGTPMASARIDFWGVGASVSATTIADGSYELFVPTGIYQTSGRPGLTDTDVEGRRFGDVYVAGDLTYDVPFVGIWWTGTVRSPDDGNPIAGADLWVWPYYAGAYPRELAHVVSDATGSFKVSVATPGWHGLQLSAPGRDVVQIEIIPAGADSTFDLTAGARIAP